MRAGIWDGISRCGRTAEDSGTSIMPCRFRLCTLKRRIRLSPELSRSAPTALHLQDESRIPHLTTSTGIFLPRWEPRNTQGLPIHDSVNSHRRSLFAGFLVFGLSTIDPTRRVGLECNPLTWRSESCLRLLACTGLSRFSLGQRVEFRLAMSGKLRIWRPGFRIWDLLDGPR